MLKVISIWFDSYVHFKTMRYAYLPYLTVTINYSLRENTFPEEVKRSEVILLYNKLNLLKKENYISVTVFFIWCVRPQAPRQQAPCQHVPLVLFYACTRATYVYDTYCLEPGTKKLKERTKTSNLITFR